MVGLLGTWDEGWGLGFEQGRDLGEENSGLNPWQNVRWLALYLVLTL